MNTSYFNQVLNSILCQLKDVKTNIAKKIAILWEGVTITDDVSSINFTGNVIVTGVQGDTEVNIPESDFSNEEVRFGIEDNMSPQERYVDMNGYGLTLESLATEDNNAGNLFITSPYQFYSALNDFNGYLETIINQTNTTISFDAGDSVNTTEVDINPDKFIVTSDGLQFDIPSKGDGFILTSDADGNATWVEYDLEDEYIRFGLEDNMSPDERYVDMNGYGLTLESAATEDNDTGNLFITSPSQFHSELDNFDGTLQSTLDQTNEGFNLTVGDSVTITDVEVGADLFSVSTEILRFNIPSNCLDCVLTSDADGYATWQPAAGGDVYTTDNGMTASTSTNFQWGGTLLHDTTINSDGYNSEFIGSNAVGSTNDSSVLYVKNTNTSFGAKSLKVEIVGAGNYAIDARGTSSAVAVYAESDSAAGVWGASSSGVGVIGASSTASAVEGTTQSGDSAAVFTNQGSSFGAKLANFTSSASGLVPILELRSSVSNPTVAAVGHGTSIIFKAEVTTGTSQKMGDVEMMWTDPTTATYTSKYNLRLAENAAYKDVFTMLGTGQQILPEYGTGNFIDTAVYSLGVKADGSVIEFAETVDWHILGNSGTNSSIHFVGTIDSQNLMFRANNIRSGIIDITNDNAGLGYSIFTALTSGTGNSAFGSQALHFNTTGYNNVAVGAYSLYTNTTGFSNIAIGGSALYAATTATFNVAVGEAALASTTTGSYNTAVGSNTLIYNTTGYNNTAIGVNAQNKNTTGYSNTSVGTFSLSENTTGYYNVAVGSSTLATNTTGTSNVAIGYTSLAENTTGSQNVSIGLETLHENSSGTYNIALGQKAMYLNTTGSFNTAIGEQSFSTQVDKRFNVGVGGNSGQYVIGEEHTSVGYEAMQQALTIERNAALGFMAGLYSERDYNTAIGCRADSQFKDNTGAAKTFNGSDITTPNQVTITSHGFGSAGTRVNLRFTQGSGPLGSFVSTNVYIVTVIDANTLSLGGLPTGSATTGHSFTPQYYYTNSTSLGYNSQTTKSNQIMLGDTNIAEVRTTGVVLSKYGSMAGDPTATEIPDGFTAVWRNTSSGNTYLWANVGGSLIKVQLT